MKIQIEEINFTGMEAEVFFSVATNKKHYFNSVMNFWPDEEGYEFGFWVPWLEKKYPEDNIIEREVNIPVEWKREVEKLVIKKYREYIK